MREQTRAIGDVIQAFEHPRVRTEALYAEGNDNRLPAVGGSGACHEHADASVAPYLTEILQDMNDNPFIRYEKASAMRYVTNEAA